MDEHYLSDRNDPLTLDAKIGPNDILYVTVSGKITNERLYVFIAWTQKVKQMIRELLARGKTEVLVLSDVSGVSYFERQPITPLKELLDYDKQYPIKSAIFGASQLTRMLLDAVISLTGRTNIRLFSDKKEALAWLLSHEPKEMEEKENPLLEEVG